MRSRLELLQTLIEKIEDGRHTPEDFNKIYNIIDCIRNATAKIDTINDLARHIIVEGE